jgi:hypothetical protein
MPGIVEGGCTNIPQMPEPPRQSRSLIWLTVMPALAILAVMGAGAAKATPTAFNGTLAGHDVKVCWCNIISVVSWDYADAQNLANVTCGERAKGCGAVKIIRGVTPSLMIKPSDARFVIHAAEWHFCPVWYSD